MNINLSKSNFVKGVQCPKMLWLAEHAEDEKDDLDNSLIFKNGHRVGDLAKDHFGEFVEVTFDREKKAEMIAETKEYLDEGRENICEASFGYDGLFCMVDVLHRNEDGTFDMIEVKSSTSLKDIYKYDVAFQYYVLTHAGIDLRKAYCMYITKGYERTGELDRDEFFTLDDCTDYAIEMQDEIERRLNIINDIMVSDTEPDIQAGPQCDDPYECEFKTYCGAPKEEYRDIAEAIPIDSDPVAEFTGEISYPLCYLWIDHCGWPIPPYDGMTPYRQTPFHYSLFAQNDEGEEPEFHEFMPDVRPGEAADPRRPLAEAICRDVPEGAVIVTCRRGTEGYDKNVEARMIKNLAYAYPDLKDRLLEVSGSCIDIAVAFEEEYTLCTGPADGMKEEDTSYLYLHEKAGEEFEYFRDFILAQGKQNAQTLVRVTERLLACGARR